MVGDVTVKEYAVPGRLIPGRKEETMKTRKTKGGLVTVMKNYKNDLTGVKVELTRMTAKSGTIIYAVQIKRLFSGKRYRIWKFDRLGQAYRIYKMAVA